LARGIDASALVFGRERSDLAATGSLANPGPDNLLRSGVYISITGFTFSL
jgi:hypothetical protein